MVTIKMFIATTTYEYVKPTIIGTIKNTYYKHYQAVYKLKLFVLLIIWNVESINYFSEMYKHYKTFFSVKLEVKIVYVKKIRCILSV